MATRVVLFGLVFLLGVACNPEETTESEAIDAERLAQVKNFSGNQKDFVDAESSSSEEEFGASPEDVLQIKVDPEQLELIEGLSATLAIAAVRRDGKEVSLESGVTFVVPEEEAGEFIEFENSPRFDFKARSPGEYKVRVQFSGKSYVLPILVKEKSITNITVNPSSIVLGVPTKFGLNEVYDNLTQASVSEEVTWKNRSPKGLTMDEEKAGVFTGRKVGTFTVEASYIPTGGEASDRLNVSSSVEVLMPRLTKIEIQIGEEDDGNIILGALQKIRAIGTFTSGKEFDITESVSWKVDDEELAKVSSDGVFEGLDAGYVNITASYEDTHGTREIFIVAEEYVSYALEIERYNKEVQSLQLIEPNLEIWQLPLAQTSVMTLPELRTFVDTLLPAASEFCMKPLPSYDGEGNLIPYIKNPNSGLDCNGGALPSELVPGSREIALVAKDADVLTYPEGYDPVSILAKDKSSFSRIAEVVEIPLGFEQRFKLFGVNEDGDKIDITAFTSWTSGNDVVARFEADSLLEEETGQLDPNRGDLKARILDRETTWTAKYARNYFTVRVKVVSPAVERLEVVLPFEYNKLLDNPTPEQEGLEFAQGVCGYERPKVQVLAWFTDNSSVNYSDKVTFDLEKVSSPSEAESLGDLTLVTEVPDPATLPKYRPETVPDIALPYLYLNSVEEGTVKINASYIDPVLGESATSADFIITPGIFMELGIASQANVTTIPYGKSLQLSVGEIFTCGVKGNVNDTANWQIPVGSDTMAFSMETAGLLVPVAGLDFSTDREVEITASSEDVAVEKPFKVTITPKEIEEIQLAFENSSDVPTTAVDVGGTPLSAIISAKYTDGSWEDITTAEATALGASFEIVYGTVYSETDAAVNSIDLNAITGAVVSKTKEADVYVKATITPGDTPIESQPTLIQVRSKCDVSTDVKRMGLYCYYKNDVQNESCQEICTGYGASYHTYANQYIIGSHAESNADVCEDILKEFKPAGSSNLAYSDGVDTSLFGGPVGCVEYEFEADGVSSFYWARVASTDVGGDLIATTADAKSSVARRICACSK